MNNKAAFVLGAIFGYMVLPKVWMEVSGLLAKRK